MEGLGDHLIGKMSSFKPPNEDQEGNIEPSHQAEKQESEGEEEVKSSGFQKPDTAE